MEKELVFALVAFAFGIPSFVIYVVHMMRGDTRPHPFSWFIWLITQLISTIGVWKGGGGYGLYYPIFYSFTIFAILLIFLVQSKKKDSIEKYEWVCFVGCLIGIALWIYFHNVLWAVVIATIVDGVAFAFTYKKAYSEPWSESIWAWGLMIPNGIAGLLAMENYNILTILYPLVMLLLTIFLVLLCWARRANVPRPLKARG